MRQKFDELYNEKYNNLEEYVAHTPKHYQIVSIKRTIILNTSLFMTSLKNRENFITIFH